MLLAFTSSAPALRLSPAVQAHTTTTCSRAVPVAQSPADDRPKFASGLLGQLLGLDPAGASTEPRSAANGNLPEVTTALGLSDPWPGRDLAWKNAELEAIFYSFDKDSDGYLERRELEDALVDYPLTTEQLSALFEEHSSTRADAGNIEVIDLENFKVVPRPPYTSSCCSLYPNSKP